MDSQTLKTEIGRIVDKWVSEVLKSRFLQKPSSVPDRSLWDKFKQGMTNWWWGPKGDKWNPYVWRNRFGDELGVKESFNPSVFSLKEYMDLRGVVESVESNLNEDNQAFDNLRLMKVVRSAAEELKTMLFNALNGRIEQRPPEQPPAPSEPTAVAQSNPTAVGSRSSEEDEQDDGETEVMSSIRSASRAAPLPATSAAEEDDEEARDPTSNPSLRPSGAATASDSPAAKSIASGRKTNRSKIEDSAEEISRMESSEKSTMIPQKDWIGKDGAIKKEKLAHVIAWMAMKPHVDPLDGSSIKEELKKSLGLDVDLGIPGTSKGVLRKYLEDTLFGNFQKVMDKLGVEVESNGSKEKGKDSTPADAGTTSTVAKSSEKMSQNKSEKSVDEEEGGELDKYFKDGKKERPIRESIELILGFLKHFSKDLSAEKKDALKEWWEDKRKELTDIFNPEDRRDSLMANVVGTESYISQLSRVVGLDASSIKTKMIEYIKSF